MKLSDLKPNPSNPRTIKNARFKKLCDSIRDFPKMMVLRPIIYEKETGKILGGNMRYLGLKKLGFTEIPDEWVRDAADLTEDEKRRFIVEDNISFGDFNFDLLANEFNTDELVEWGFDEKELGISPDEPKDSPPQIDRAEELNKKWQVKTGDLWVLGNHRLLCGDSTKGEDVGKLLVGEAPALMVTDPPYGVEYDPEWRENFDLEGEKKFHKGIGRSKGKALNDDRVDWTETWVLFPGKIVYVWHAGRYSATVQKSLEDAGFEIRYQIIWNKQHFVFGRGAYHWKHEPCLYGVKKNNNSDWIGDRTQTTVWDIQNLNPMGGGDRTSKTMHSNEKPLECMSRPIRNHKGDVYDPFLGSGTTMVACQNLNRKYRGIEISTAYCAVILERMATAFPDLKIERISHGRTQGWS